MAGKKIARTCCYFLLLLFLAPAAAWAQSDCTETFGSGPVTITLATGSPGELGLLEVLANAFNKTHNIKI